MPNTRKTDENRAESLVHGFKYILLIVLPGANDSTAGGPRSRRPSAKSLGGQGGGAGGTFFVVSVSFSCFRFLVFVFSFSFYCLRCFSSCSCYHVRFPVDRFIVFVFLNFVLSCSFLQFVCLFVVFSFFAFSFSFPLYSSICF